MKQKFVDLTGKKFNRLTIIEKIFVELKSGEKILKWKCQCDCGEIIINLKYDLESERVKSCGCYNKETAIMALNSKKEKENIIGKKFNMLYVKEKIDNKYLCICDCGNEKLTTLRNLRKSTKSCGCLLDGKISQFYKSGEVEKSRRSSIAFGIYNKTYADGDITFPKFLELSQQNCFYCGINPQPKEIKTQNLSKSNNAFIFNGLDRINNDKNHNLDNCVPCCYNCNSFKLTRSILEFFNWVKNIYNISILKNSYELYSSSLNNKQITLLKNYVYRRYNEGNIEFENFLKLSQQNCFYCGDAPSNKAIHKNKLIDVYYNGLDRINNSIKTHTLENCVPCCKYCNTAKRNLDVNTFLQIVEKIYNLNIRDKLHNAHY